MSIAEMEIESLEKRIIVIQKQLADMKASLARKKLDSKRRDSITKTTGG